jgi:hypothetical protein
MTADGILNSLSPAERTGKEIDHVPGVGNMIGLNLSRC